MLEILLLGILPIVFYVFIDMKYGMKPGIIAAVASVIVVLSWLFIKTGEIDTFIIVDAVLLLGLGLLSIRLNSPRYFRFQPFTISLLTGFYILYFQIFSEPIFIHYLPLLQKLAPPDRAHVFFADGMPVFLSVLSLHLGIAFIVHALICAVAAMKWSNLAWMFAKLSMYPIALVIMVVDMIKYQPMIG